MKNLKLVRLVDVKAYIDLLDRKEITMSRFAEILNECANESLRIHDVVGRSEQLVCDCTHTQACKICAKSKDIDWDDEWDKAN